MPRQINEERTRKEMIDPAFAGGIVTSTLPSVAVQRPHLEQAGWYFCDHAEEQAKVFDYGT